MIATFALTAPARSVNAAVITGATIQHQDAVTEIDFAVKGHGLGWRLTIHGQQLWIDLSHVRLDLAPHPLLGDGQPPIASVRTADSGDGTARIIVEVTGRANYAIARIPHELVLRVAPAGTPVDLAAPFIVRTERYRHRPPVNESSLAIAHRVTGQPNSASFNAAAYPGPIAEPVTSHPSLAAPIIAGAATSSMLPVQPENPELASYSVTRHTDASRASPDAMPSPVTANEAAPLVVIDPGHGGRDPGTSAADGTTEKALALAIASRLCMALKAEGIRAEMTRTNDTFLSLPERTALANQAGADLFVSIHLNSSPDTATSGIETYYLNNTTDRATIRLAQMENGGSTGYSLSGAPNLNYILTDMRQQYKAIESASLATMIETDAAASVSSSLGLQLNALGARQGPFYVLVGAMMPAVLVECGFLSNPGEAQLLETPRYQQAIADGIARAVAHYFDTGATAGTL
ncbi:MAG TPA: N-acetylmuramoyl-L-alanine amidase [Candidatus Binataceae bacterium]|nr:N-acetylmuramoyl-L-alanine amidase [Candidatus Binataceae bacterium]